MFFSTSSSPIPHPFSFFHLVNGDSFAPLSSRTSDASSVAAAAASCPCYLFFSSSVFLSSSPLRVPFLFLVLLFKCILSHARASSFYHLTMTACVFFPSSSCSFSTPGNAFTSKRGKRTVRTGEKKRRRTEKEEETTQSAIILMSHFRRFPVLSSFITNCSLIFLNLSPLSSLCYLTA